MSLLRRLIPMSFSGQLALVGGGGLLVFAMALGGVGVLTLHGQWQRSLEQRADPLARQLAAVTLDAMLMRDYGTIDRYLEDIVDGDAVVAAQVVKANGQVLSHQGRFPEANAFTSQAPIQLAGQEEGRVRVAISGPHLLEALGASLALIGGVLAIATVLFFLLLRRYLMTRLIEPLRTLASGVSPLQPEPESPDTLDMPHEIRELAHSFQSMRSRIAEHIQAMEEANQQIRCATERACSEHRLAALGQLSAGLAHGLNTPIANVIGYAQMGQRAVEPQSEAGEAFAIIERQGRSCSHIVSNLLDMAGQIEPVPEAAPLERLLPEFARMLRPSLESAGLDTVNTSVDENLVAWADPGILEHVIFNLATNAVQAGASHLMLSAWKAEGKACLDITDNGPGMPPDLQEQDHLFDPFVTTKAKGHGTGLGLYMCRTLLDAMGGSIQLAESSPGGTRFRLALNLCCRAHPSNESPPSQADVSSPDP